MIPGTVRSRLPAQRGLSLVELLVALGLGAFITVGIIQMFTANRETYQVSIGQARLQENARFGMEFVARPARMAGYRGCFSDESADILNVLNPVAGETPYEFEMSEAVIGYEATSATTWSPPLSDLPADIVTANIAPGTDVLTIKTVDSSGIRLSADMPSSSAVIKTTTPADEDMSSYDDGAVLMISDCQKAAIFQITNTQLASGDTELSIAHNDGNAGVVPGNTQKELTRDGSAFRADASVYALQTQVFYISATPVVPATLTPSGFRENNRGDVILSLYRKFGDDSPAELVEGVEDFQVLYGVDTDDDKVPNRYRTIQNITDSSTIITMRICMTTTSVDAVSDGSYPFTDCTGNAPVTKSDGLLRRNFVKTIAIRNRI